MGAKRTLLSDQLQQKEQYSLIEQSNTLIEQSRRVLRTMYTAKLLRGKTFAVFAFFSQL